MRLLKLLKINSNIKILLSIFMISILFSCKDKQ
ncbi:putative lipoprotein, partial [Leptospira interrogans serovar Medanensis str. UT053]